MDVETLLWKLAGASLEGNDNPIDGGISDKENGKPDDGPRKRFLPFLDLGFLPLGRHPNKAPPDEHEKREPAGDAEDRFDDAADDDADVVGLERIIELGGGKRGRGGFAWRGRILRQNRLRKNSDESTEENE